MSTAEPFMPSHEPSAEPDPRERDLDIDADVLHEKEAADPDAEAAAARRLERDRHIPFRTPSGQRLSGEALEHEIEAGSDQDS